MVETAALLPCLRAQMVGCRVAGCRLGGDGRDTKRFDVGDGVLPGIKARDQFGRGLYHRPHLHPRVPVSGQDSWFRTT